MTNTHAHLAPRRVFFYRLFVSAIVGTCFLLLTLFVGMAGYHYLENMAWIDAFANASMILSGMGPLVPLTSTAGKLFAGIYALFSGLVFLMVMGIIFAPVIHRLFHAWHLQDSTKD